MCDHTPPGDHFFLISRFVRPAVFFHKGEAHHKRGPRGRTVKTTYTTQPKKTKKRESFMRTMKAASSGADFEACPAGNHAAVLLGIVDLGTQKESFQGQLKEVEKLFLVWEVMEKDAQGKHFVIGREYTRSLHEKAGLRKLIESWRGKKLDEGESFDPGKLIGKPCLLTVLNEEKSGKTFHSVGGVSAMPKGMAVPKATYPTFSFDIAENDIDDFPMHSWMPWSYGRTIHTIAQLSPEWSKAKAAKSNGATGEVMKEPAPNMDADEAPF